MGARIKSGVKSIKDAFNYFFLELLDGSSTRTQLVWLTAFSWCSAGIWFGIVLPLTREISIIFYRQNAILGKPIDLSSPYADQILNMLSLAFMGTVAAYVASKFPSYKVHGDNIKKDVVTTDSNVE